MTTTLNVIIVDDEALARQRLRTLLSDCPDPVVQVTGEAADAVSAMTVLQHRPCDVLLLDIHMPGTTGLQLARAVRQLPSPPLVVFVTAHAEHALEAFDVEALDYLTKPVRLPRLQAALKKAEQATQHRKETSVDQAAEFVLIHDRGRTERVFLSEIVYLKAELKYVTVRTAERSYIYDGSLSEFEDRHAAHWLRIHRNALVARHAIRALERFTDPLDPDDKGDGWAVRLAGVPEHLVVSRRQLAAVREALGMK